MKRSVRWFLVAVLLADAVGAAFLLGVRAEEATQPVVAESPAEPAESAEPEAVEPSHEALRLLGLQLAERAERLRLREEELDELLRGPEVLRLAGIVATDEPAEASPSSSSSTAAQDAFVRLSRAYENMEPDSAALALTELAGIDQDAVVQLLEGWRPRVSGAILDALAQSNPRLAANLSYEIWKRGGKNASPAATDGH